MSPDPAVIYRIDRADRIIYVNDAWTGFAVVNSGEDLLPPPVLGSLLFEAISDVSTREVYRLLLQRVRNAPLPLRFRFRCDGPRQQRLLEMTMSGLTDNSVEFSTVLVASAERPAVRLIDPAEPRTDTLLRLCGWCMRVAMSDDRWIEVGQAVADLRLLEQPSLPSITHGMCPECFETMEMAITTHEGSWPSDVSVGGLAMLS